MITFARTLVLLCAALLLGPLASPPAAARGGPTAAERKRLERWEVLGAAEKAGARRYRATARGLFADAPEAVLFVLVGLGKYKHFLPRVSESRVTRRDGWHTYAVLRTDLPWPAKDAWIYVKATRHYKPGRTYELRWTMLNGTLKHCSGVARMKPYGRGKGRALLTYTVTVELATRAPDAMLLSGLRNTVSTIVHRTRMRLSALRKYGRIPKGM